MPNVCDIEVYKAQTYASFYYLIVSLLLSVQDNGNVEEFEALQFLKELMDTCVKSADVINGA